MAFSKCFFLLLSALFALVFVLSSEVSTSNAISRDREIDQFSNLKVNCQSPLRCCHYSRQGYCTSCCCCEGARDQNQLVLASLNDQFGIDCYGLRCCHYNRQGYCTACCAAATSEVARATDQESIPANEVEDIELITMVAK